MGVLKRVLFLCCVVFAVVGCTDPIKYPACETDKHCKNKNAERPNEVCENKTCVECRNDDGCSDGYLCKANKCEPECTTDADCTSPKICKELKCAYECEKDGDCKEGYTCKEYKCEVKLECTQDMDCDAGLKCTDNKCIAPITKIATVEEVCTLTKINFDFNEHLLTADAKATLDANVECITKKNAAVTIEGHCDERGTEEYNLNLGQKRANAVRKYLKDGGVETTLKTVSKGEEEPVDSASNEDAWAKNRRSEIDFQ